MKENFKILEHISELRIRAFGKTRKELFLNMMRGMFSVIAPKTDSRQPTAFDRNPEREQAPYGTGKFGTGQTDKRIIKIKSQDINALLVDFLNECLYFSQINHEIYQNIKFERFTETELEGVLMGQKVARLAEDIKAVTYHGVEVKKNNNGFWRVDVIYDI